MPSIEEARQWVSQRIWDCWGPEPVDIYCKGEYRNIAYVSFMNKQDRDKCIQVLQKAKIDGMKIKEDLPPAIRAPKNILLGLRWMLMQWEFKNVRVDNQYTKLTVGSTTVLTIALQDNKMSYAWDEEWKTWDIFQQHDSTKKIFLDAENILNGSSKGLSKGKNGR